MKRTNNLLSEWLKLLCKDWSDANTHIIDNVDSKFVSHKPYLKEGKVSSQLLCRLCIPSETTFTTSGHCIGTSSDNHHQQHHHHHGDDHNDESTCNICSSCMKPSS